MGHGGVSGMGHGRMFEIVEKFRERGATSPETALAIEERGLPPMFDMMIRGPMGQSGLFGENDGKYYLNEERFKQIRARFGDG